MKVGQLISLQKGDLAVPLFVSKENIVYSLWFQQGEEVELNRLPKPDYEAAKSLKEFLPTVKKVHNLFMEVPSATN